MANSYFQFKQFRIDQDNTAMKVTTDACLLGAWSAQIAGPDQEPHHRILDIGTGTGLLAMMMTQVTGLPVDAVEIEPNAATQASGNFSDSQWSDRLSVIHTDINLYHPAGLYKYIISNPPFYEQDLRSGIHAKDLAHHDEGLSLDKLISSIRRLLAADGLFFLLLPVKRKEALFALLKQNGLRIVDHEEVTQTTSHTPFRILVCGSHEITTSDGEVHASATHNNNSQTKNIENSDGGPRASHISTAQHKAIRQDDQQYTDWFKTLLQPFYLYL